MKTTVILKTLCAGIIAMLLNDLSLHGQPGPAWFTGGNNGTNPNFQFVGTTDNFGLAFRTDNTEVARFDVIGNFGIGILSPVDRLQIGFGDTRIGEINPASSGTFPNYGRKIWFSGGPSGSAANCNSSENSDDLWIARFNQSCDRSQLRINITNGPVPNNDMVNIGKRISTAPFWVSYLAVNDNGTIGINKENAGNNLEINAGQFISSIFTPTANASGLRFSNLTSLSTPVANPGEGVLTVDEAGDVILVAGGEDLDWAIEFTQNTPDNLLNNIWTDGRVGIGGTFLNNPVTERLDVVGNARFRQVPNNGLNQVLITGTLAPPSPSPANTEDVILRTIRAGADGQVLTSNNGQMDWGDLPPVGPAGADDDWLSSPGSAQVGAITDNIYTEGSVGIGNIFSSNPPIALLDVHEPFSIGLDPIAVNVLNQGDGGIGVRSVVTNIVGNKTLIAGWFEATSKGAPTHAIVVPAGGGNVGFGTIAPNLAFRLQVDGDVDIIGDAFSNQGLLTSDARFKTNIDTLNNALAKILQLQGVYYDWDTLNYPARNFSSGRKIGFIAQDIEPIIPEVVVINDSGFYSLDYDRFAPVIVEAIKEQNSIIDSMRSENSTLSNELDSIKQCLASLPPGLACNGGVSGNFQSMNKNSGGQAPKMLNNVHRPWDDKPEKRPELQQNNPNPFNENTEINYYIPKTANSGALYIYDLQGKQVKMFNNLDKGNGSVTLSGRELYAGMFIYTLIVDGKDFGTKRMILTE